MLKERIFSAIIGLILILIFIFSGSIPFAILISIISLLAMREYNRMVRITSFKNLVLLTIFSLFTILYTYLTSKGLFFIEPGFYFVCLTLTYFIFHLYLYHGDDLLYKLSTNLFGLIYISGGLSFFILLRDYQNTPFTGTKALWLVLIATWATDTGAYFTGNLLGKTRLAPTISPNKTVEGAVGGILLSIIFIALFSILTGGYSFLLFIYSILVSIVAMVGDLFESSIKRDTGIKDTGTILPGHGGVLDRIDSLLFTAPFTYYFLYLIVS